MKKIKLQVKKESQEIIKIREEEAALRKELQTKHNRIVGQLRAQINKLENEQKRISSINTNNFILL